MSSDPAASESDVWRTYALEDLHVAMEMADGDCGTPRHACLLAQQAAEKMIKAVLIRLQVEYPRSHDLDRLRLLLPTAVRRAIDGIDLAELSEWAVESRYPGDWPELSAGDARRAVEVASAVCNSLAPYAQGPR